MSIEIVKSCPLGGKCSEIRDNIIHECEWLIEIAGMHPSTGENINQKKCAMSWIPILLIENSATNRGQTQAIESLRNETVDHQKAAVMTLAGILQKRIAP